jgi:predicted 3-demethylubiquinone-9 3-methyltransferase (glyoxalase superfamily)
MKNIINPCLWFDENAKEAADFYCATFGDADILTESPLVVTFKASGHKITCLNGGPQFKGNPSISLYYICETEEELDRLWLEIAKEGKILLPLSSYDWSEKYGWIQDKYNVSWQFSINKVEEVGQKITPCLLFSGNKYGKAEDAIVHYTSVFKKSGVDGILRFDKTEAPNKEGAIKHAQISLNGQKIMIMENNKLPNFEFNEAISLVVNCQNQEEIDFYWAQLTKGGSESVCGWLRDKFGVSWQVVPVVLEELMRNDVDRAERVVKAFLQMKKIEIEKLISA